MTDHRDLGFDAVVGSDGAVWNVATSGAGPAGRLPLTAQMLLDQPSGDVFGLTQNAGMGWDPGQLDRPQFLMLSTQGGIRAPDGRPVALGYHTGHYYQITSALTHLSFGKHVAVLTDARFSGVSTGVCIGHIGPEALAGGPIGRVLDGDLIRIEVDRHRLEGRIDLVGHGDERFGAEESGRVLAAWAPRPDLTPDPDLPDDTRLWAALQQAGGGWGGCVYDVDAIVRALGGEAS